MTMKVADRPNLLTITGHERPLPHPQGLSILLGYIPPRVTRKAPPFRECGLKKINHGAPRRWPVWGFPGADQAQVAGKRTTPHRPN